MADSCVLVCCALKSLRLFGLAIGCHIRAGKDAAYATPTISLDPTHYRQRGENAPAVILCDRATAPVVRNALSQGGAGPLGTRCAESYRTTQTPAPRLAVRTCWVGAATRVTNR